METDKLLAWIYGALAVVKVSGRGSFKVGAALREFGAAALGSGARRIVLDLEDCVGMDSTFMGIVAGLALKANLLPKGRVVFVHLNDRTRHLLNTLGLARFVDMHMAGETPASLLPALTAPHPEQSEAATGSTSLAETMLRAHEDLVRIDPENLSRFRDVLVFLQKDVDRNTPVRAEP